MRSPWRPPRKSRSWAGLYTSTGTWTGTPIVGPLTLVWSSLPPPTKWLLFRVCSTYRDRHKLCSSGFVLVLVWRISGWCGFWAASHSVITHPAKAAGWMLALKLIKWKQKTKLRENSLNFMFTSYKASFSRYYRHTVVDSEFENRDYQSHLFECFDGYNCDKQ